MPEVKIFRVRPQPPVGASEDKTLVMISLELAAKHGIELDELKFPTPQSLVVWHKIHNPQIFKKQKK